MFFRKVPANSYKLAAVSFVAVVILGLFGFWLYANRTTTFEADGVRFSYPVAYDDLTFTAAKGVVARLKRTDPEAVITLTLEKNADAGANLAHANFLDNLEANATKSLPMSYKNYKEDDANRVKLNGYDVSRRTFHYTGSDGKSTVYVNLYIIPRGHDAYYLTTESTDKAVSGGAADKVSSTLSLP